MFHNVVTANVYIFVLITFHIIFTDDRVLSETTRRKLVMNWCTSSEVISMSKTTLQKEERSSFLTRVFNFFTDAATFVYVNIFVRSFSKIDDVKMVRTELSSSLIIQRVITIWMLLCFHLYWMSLMKTCKIFWIEDIQE